MISNTPHEAESLFSNAYVMLKSLYACTSKPRYHIPTNDLLCLSTQKYLNSKIDFI